MGQHRDHIENSQTDAAGQLALRELFERYRGALLAYFARRTRNQSDAEDLTHDVFVRLGRLDPATELYNAEAFIFQTAANLLRDRARRAEAQRSVIVPSSPMPEPPAGEPDAERVLGAKVELSRVMDALSTLSEKTRNIFILRRLEQMKCEEIAAFYGISVSAVEQHITKALAHLARTIKRP